MNLSAPQLAAAVNTPAEVWQAELVSKQMQNYTNVNIPQDYQEMKEITLPCYHQSGLLLLKNGVPQESVLGIIS